MLVILALLSALVEFALFGNALKPAALYLWTSWTAPAWLAWYLVACAPSTTRTTALQALKATRWFQALHGVRQSESTND
jgi:hypothetical protein